MSAETFGVELGPWDRMVAELLLAVVVQLGVELAAARIEIGTDALMREVAAAHAMILREPGRGSLVFVPGGVAVIVRVRAPIDPVEVELDAWSRMRAAMLTSVVDSAPSKSIACAVLSLKRSLLRSRTRAARKLLARPRSS